VSAAAARSSCLHAFLPTLAYLLLLLLLHRVAKVHDDERIRFLAGGMETEAAAGKKRSRPAGGAGGAPGSALPVEKEKKTKQRR
jgi:hypothetical protein